MCYDNSCPSICGPLKPDSDIAGIGVVVTFTVSGIISLTCLISLYAYCVEEISYQDKNQLDRWINRALQSRINNDLRNWRDIIIPFSISLNDSQLAGTCAILVAGLIQPTTKISVYHFSIVSDLAWIVSATSGAGFYVTHTWTTLRENRSVGSPHAYIWIRSMRLMVNIINCALLGYYSYRQANRCWDGSYECPVDCLSKAWKDTGGVGKRWMFANWTLLGWDCIEHIAFTFSSFRRRLQGLTDSLENFLLDLADDDKLYNRQCIVARVACAILRSLLRTGAGVVIVLESLMFNISIHTGWFAYNFVVLLKDREWAQTYFKQRGDDGENLWGFGQIFPIVMLALPFFSIVQAIGDAKLEHTVVRT